jgi:hypothetical protein
MPQEKMTMDQVRERFPEYDDMDDMTLANAIHGRFYSDIPLADFYASVGFNPQQDAGDNSIYPDTGPGSSPNNPIDLATVDRATAAGMKRGMWVKGPDGTVYPLPSDPVEGQFRVGDLPQAPGVNVRPQSVVEDIAKSLPTGVVEGLTGLAGMQGTIGQMIYGEQSLGQNMPGFGIVGPTGEQLNETIRQGLGRDYYQPQTVAGEYSRTFGEFLPGALAPGSALARGASVAVPAFTSETAGQIARGMSGGERDTNAENFARLLGGLGGGFAVGGASAVRGGADISLRNAAEGVTPQNLQLATALRRDAEAMGIDLTNAEAIQQVTGGGSGLGRLQRVVEGQTTRMAPMFANRPAQVQGAIESRLNQIAPSVEPSTLAPRVRDAAEGVLTRLRQRANEDAGPFYRRLPEQSIPEDQYAQLANSPSYQTALQAVRNDPEIAPLIADPFTTGPVYHGTPDVRGLAGGFKTPQELYGVNDSSRAFWFTDNPSVARTYADPQRAWDYQNAEPGVLEARLRLQNPLEIEGAGRRWSGTAGALDEARAGGNDSVIVRNSVDDYMGQGGPSTVYSVFDPQNIRLGPATGDRGLQVVNEVVKQLRTMAEEAAPNSARVGGSMTRASVRGEAADLADALARQASPDYGMARDTVRGINEAFIDPLKAGPIGALADAGPAPNLVNMTGRMFPDTPFEGQAAETARALELMGEIDPSVGGPLVRQQLARQAMEAQQELATGSNQFGGANFAARAFGNPEQRRTVMGALDVVNRSDPNMAFPALSANAAPARGSDPMAQLVEVLQATGQRHRAGSDTAFNQDIQRQIAGGNVATGAVRSVANIPGIPGRIATGIDDIVARRNAETLADLLMANSEDFNARLTRALNRPRGANRIRAGVAVTAGQED